MKRLILFFMTAGLAGTLYAISGSQVGSVIKLQYTEPSNTEPDVNGSTSPLTDLAYTSVYYQVSTSSFAVLCTTVAASSPTGGQLIPANCLVPAVKGSFAYTFWATATDLVGNMSGPSNTVVLTIDHLAPAPPR